MNNGDYIRGRRLTNAESVSLMFPDIPILPDDEINKAVAAFNKVPLFNAVSIVFLQCTSNIGSRE